AGSTQERVDAGDCIPARALPAGDETAPVGVCGLPIEPGAVDDERVVRMARAGVDPVRLRLVVAVAAGVADDSAPGGEEDEAELVRVLVGVRVVARRHDKVGVRLLDDRQAGAAEEPEAALALGGLQRG